MKKRKFWSIMLVCSLLLTLPSMEVFADSIGNINSGEDAVINIQTEGLGDADGDIGTEAGKESEPEEDNESEEENADTTDITPEEEDEEKQEDTADSEQTDEEDKEDKAGNATDAEKPETVEEAEENLTDEVQIDEEQAEAELYVQLASDDIASGSYKDITWVIDASGKLTVVGSGNVKDSKSHYVPWYECRGRIVSAEIRVTGMTDAKRLFLNCSELKNIDISHFDTCNVTNMEAMFNGCTSLTTLDLSSLDTSNVTSMKGMFGNCSNITSLDFSSFDTSNVTDMSYMFGECYKLSTVNLDSFDTGKVTDMSQMFQNCRITDLNLSHFDTHSVTNMHDMFQSCYELTNLNISHFDTHNVTDMGQMFNDCMHLGSLDLSSFDTSNVTRMVSMFSNCSNLTSLDLSNFDTSNVTDMRYMFSDNFGDSKLAELNLSSFDTSNVTSMESMFSGCKSLNRLDLSSFDTSEVTDMRHMFAYCENLTSLNFSSFNTSKVPDMNRMFSGCGSLESLDLSSFDTSNVPDMSDMFSGCGSLKSLNLSSFNTSKVTNMNRMFAGCGSLESLDLSSFDTSKVTNMSYMFNGCHSLTSLDLHSFNTAKVTDMSHMFSSGLVTYDGSKLTELDLSNFDTSKVTNMSNMFSGCGALTDLNLNNFVTRNVTNMDSMFSYCCSLTSLDLSSFNTANVTDMGLMFNECKNLTNINLGSFDTRNVTDMNRMFSECRSLTSLNLGSFNMHNIIEYDTWYNGMGSMFSGCSSLNYIELPDDITHIGTYAFAGCSSLSSITIPNGYIHYGAFRGCENLTSVILSDGVTGIGDCSFYYCSKLNSIEIPDSVTSIGDEAFYDCSNLSDIELPGNIVDIGEYAFRGCDSLSSIVIPDGVTYISKGMFESCRNLSSVELSDSVTYIGDSAFENCNALESIEIPNGVTSIGRTAFASYYYYSQEYGLRSIDLPATITDIGDGAFRDCLYLQNVYYGGNENNWKAVNIGSDNEYLTNATIHYASTESQTISGVLRSGDDWKIYWKCTYKPGSNGPRSGRLEISINDFGFEEELYLYNETGGGFPWELEPYNIPKSAITTLMISGTSKKKLRIPTNAFKGYSNLYSAVFECVSGIDSAAFEGCNVLHGVYFLKDDKTLRIIDDGAFKNCTNLAGMTFPATLERIGAGAFQNTALKTIYLGSSIKEIGDDAFSGCKNLLIYCNGGSCAHMYAMSNNIPFKMMEGTPTDTRIRKKELPFYGWDTTGMQQMDWGWDLILQGISSIYDNRLSKIALLLSSAAEYHEDALKGLMGDYLELESVETTPSSPQLTCGYKTIIQADGQKLYVVVAVCRGTTTLGDVITDGLSSLGNRGWNADDIYADLKKYIENRNMENDNKTNKPNIRILITGHSLGGATANIVAEELNSDYGTRNVFAYTFAAPSPFKGKPVSSSQNIHNIICLQDNVPYHLSTREIWYGYGRLGRFSVKYRPEIENNYREMTQKTFKDIWGKYRIFGTVPMRLHPTDVYMAYLLTNPNPYETSYCPTGCDLCPTDLKIYNSTGELVGSVTDNHVDEENMTMDVMLTVGGENNDEKYFYFLTDDTYTVEITGTDTGTMKYVARYVNMNTDAVITEKAFTNVALTKGKKMTSTVSAWDKADTTINTDDKIDTPDVQLFVLDNNGEPEKEVLPDGNGTEVPVGSKPDDDPSGGITDDVLPEDIPADGKIPEGLWIAGVKESYIYTGAAIKPEIRVYDGKTRLQPGQDYTVSYKNNTKVNNAAQSSIAPTITVKGKGNYAGSETATFQITAVDLSDSIVLAEDITVAYNKKVQKKVPAVTYNGKKLSANRDFTVSYPGGGDGAYKETGTYDILLTAKNGGNFSGTRTVKCTITDNTLLSNVSVKKIPAQAYTGKAIEPELTVTFKGVPLVKDTDYSVSYTNNTEIGTAKAILTGIGKYAGTKNVSFSITGTSLKGASVSGIVNKIYNGCDQEQRFTVTLKDKILTEGTDYDVFYERNKNVGKANVTIKGKGAYTGIIKKTFAVGKYNVAANADGRFEVKLEQDVVPYAKGGTKPSVTVRFKTGNEKWDTLVEGQDYTLSYRNHTAVNDGSNQNKQPVVMVKGKGSFSGTYGTAITYKIVTQDIGKLTLTAQDKTYQNKKNAYATKITITDLDGKALKPGTDYNKVLTYSYANETTVNSAGNGTIVRAAGDFVDENDIIPAGTILEVQADAQNGGNYAGTLTGEYRITQAAISSASVSVPKQIYTGRAITLEKKQITVKIKGKQLDESQYEIVPNSYKNNVKKGTATVTIRGLDNYGGTKDISFTIKAKGFLWWWR